MLPAIWIRTFSRLTSISVSGVLSSLLLTTVVVISYAVDPNREAVHDTSSAIHENVNWTHLPIAAGILVASLSGIVLVTANLNEASGVTGFVLPRLGKLRITINEVVTVLVAMSAYSTIPVSYSKLQIA
ncbi:hypothetical protein M758_11G118100 [Ceratodon purpureus]|nr:hypothetical protein M758_11G118100 [Ceratodon purpureus]